MESPVHSGRKSLVKMAGDCKLSRRLPKKLLDYLMPFQRSGIQFAIKKNGKCLIADEMGLGKTIQAIAVACFYREEWPMLIIVPSSLRYPWVEELEKWLPDVHPHDINLIQSGTDASNISQCSVTLVTFGLLSSRSSVVVKEALKSQKFKVVIVDESHYIKNFKTACSQSVVPLVKQANRRILLSGTPALARPVELYPQLEALLPGKFGNWWKFTERYCDARVQWFGKQRRRMVDGASHLGELQTRLTAEVMIRREKKDVLKQLPPKQRQRILFDLKESDLKTEILDTFEELQPYLVKAGPDLSKASSISIDRKEKTKRRKSIKHHGKGEITVLESPDQKTKKPAHSASGNVSKKLQTPDSSSKTEPRAIKGNQSTGKGVRNSKSAEEPGEKRVTMLSLISKLYKLTAEAKIGPAKDYISLLCENPTLKFLVFAYHHCMMDGIQQTLWESKVKFIRIDGNTKPAERLYFVQQFQADPDCRVAILSILAAGVGLTFTAAKLVMFAEMYWTPGVMVQCEDRAHRIGQTSCVPVHYLVAKGTMDEWVWSAVCKKTTVVTATLNGRVQSLEADEGDKYQVEILSNAEAWVPSGDLPDMDLTSFFLSQQPANQRSIRDFLTSSQSKTSKSKSVDCHPLRKSSDCPLRKAVCDDGSDIVCLTSSDEEDGGLRSLDTSKSLTKRSKGGLNKRKRSSGDHDTEVTPHGKPCHSVVDCLVTDIDDSQDFSNRSVSISRKKLKFTPKSTTCKSHKSSKVRNRRSSETIEATPPAGDTDHGETTLHGPDPKWDCGVCTYLNHSSLPYCEMCETPKKLTRTSRNQISKSLKTEAESWLEKEDESDGCKQTDDMMVSQNVAADREGQTSCVYPPSHSDTGQPCSARKLHTISSSDESEEENCESGIDIELPDLVCRKGSPSVTGDNNPDSDVNKVCPEGIEATMNASHRSTSTNSSNQSIALNFSFNLEEDNVNFDSSGQSVSPCGKETSVSCERDEGPVSEGNSDDCHPSVIYDTKSLGQNATDTTLSLCTPPTDTPAQEISVAEEAHAAAALFSPKKGGGAKEEKEEWLCPDCNVINPGWEEHCDGCLSSRPEAASGLSQGESVTKRVIDLDKIAVHKSFSYCCSKHTGRIYLFDKEKQPLHVNFLPLDVSVGNVDDLPDLLLHPANLRVVRRFVEEWNRLSETKRRFLIRHTDVFESPITAYEQLKTGLVPSINRHLTKEAVAKAAQSKAKEVEGSVRVIAPPQNPPNHLSDRGIAQVLNKEGIPLCVNCQKPYTNPLLKASTIQNNRNAWYTRFCSPDCSHNYWMKTHNEYSRGQIFELEHGICQLCKVEAHLIFRQIRDTPDIQKRAMVLTETGYSKLTAKQKANMVQNPTAGLFWHVDHIVPVWEGGGECDIDNLRTLCTPCHQRVTAEQTKWRNRARKLGDAVGCRDISSFFKPF